jgi:hypothetical protein
MESFFFITPEAYDDSPEYDRPEPEFFDLQFNDNNHDNNFQDTFEELMEINTGVVPDKFYRMDTARRNLKFFTPKPQRNKIPIAS